MKPTSLFTLILAAFFFCAAAHAVTIDMVEVGNPSNAPYKANSIASPIGSVDYLYRMGKYEVTAGQYTEFLNAVGKDDPNGLYNPKMADPISSWGANILRSGSPGNYSYDVAADWVNRPVNYVSFWDAVRFVNWLHNGQPTGAQGQGSTEDGAYHDIGNQAMFGRNPGARFFLPTSDEWFKAAHHKNDGETGNYWFYPTSSNLSPSNTLPDLGNHANFYDNLRIGNDGYAIGEPYYRTEVGAFENSPSPYGTFDQGGNVQEWSETVRSGSLRNLHGGSFGRGIESGELSANVRSGGLASLEWPNIGFRVAGIIPEPGSIALCFAGVMLLTLQRGRES